MRVEAPDRRTTQIAFADDGEGTLVNQRLLVHFLRVTARTGEGSMAIPGSLPQNSDSKAVQVNILAARSGVETLREAASCDSLRGKVTPNDHMEGPETHITRREGS
jgi:hypothetical protein